MILTLDNDLARYIDELLRSNRDTALNLHEVAEAQYADRMWRKFTAARLRSAAREYEAQRRREIDEETGDDMMPALLRRQAE